MRCVLRCSLILIAVMLVATTLADRAAPIAESAPPASDLDSAKRAHTQTLHALDDALAAAKRAHAQGIDAANRTLLAAYDQAIAQAKRRGDEAATKALKEERAAVAAKVPQPLTIFRDEAMYECVLGIYGRGQRQQQYPFVNLRPPIESNLWTKQIQKALRGKIDFEGIEYTGTAKLVIPKDGWYTLCIHEPGTQFRLNGMLMSGGDVELRQGVYDVEIYSNTWGQPYINDARAAVHPKGSDKPLPFVNTGADLSRFLTQRVCDRTVCEVTGYKPKPVDIDVRGRRGKAVAPQVDASALPIE